jgi:predicted dehydrogenase
MSHSNLAQRQLHATVIGIGGQGLRRARAVQLAKGWKLNGIYDTNQNLASKQSARLRCQCIRDIAGSLRSQSTDVVIIATPPATHDPFIEMALDLGKHVLCEKPLTINPQSALALSEKARDSGLVLATGFNHRFYAPVIDALQLVNSNVIGSIKSIKGRIGQKLDNADLSGWLGNSEISGGGVLIDNGSHLIDLALLFLEKPVKYQYKEMLCSEKHNDIDMKASFQLIDSQDICADLEASWLESDKPYLHLELHGESGSIHLSAFPLRLELKPSSGSNLVRSYFRNRVEMKLLNFMAPGLESSLWKELIALRHKILGFSSQNMNHANATDGFTTAQIVQSLKSQYCKSAKIIGFHQAGNHDNSLNHKLKSA